MGDSDGSVRDGTESKNLTPGLGVVGTLRFRLRSEAALRRPPIPGGLYLRPRSLYLVPNFFPLSPPDKVKAAVPLSSASLLPNLGAPPASALIPPLEVT